MNTTTPTGAERCLPQPLNYIKDHPVEFAIWFGVAIFVGGLSIWDSLLTEGVRSTLSRTEIGAFATILVADAIASTFFVIKKRELYPRQVLLGGGALILILFQFSVVEHHIAVLREKVNEAQCLSGDALAVAQRGIGDFVISPTLQALVLLLAIILASCLKAFKLSEFDDTADDVRKRQDEEIKTIRENAAALTSTRSGEAL